MSSTQRAYAQRNNNVTVLAPEFVTTLPDISGGDGESLLPFSITSAPIYSLTPPCNYAGGIYTVDLTDLSSGTFEADERGINIVVFTVNVPFNPAIYPGKEFTIFFKIKPDAYAFSGPFTIGIIANEFALGGGSPLPYIFSPPLPVLFTADVTQSVTFKSNSAGMSVVSSGPAGWLGLGALLSLLAAFPIKNTLQTIAPDASGAVDISYSTISNATIYPLTLPEFPIIGGQYIVDLSEDGLDSSGNQTIPLNGSGVVRAALGGYDGSANIIMFYITPPESYPYNYIGNEFTLVFKNVPSNTTRTYGAEPFLTIGITDNATFGNSNVWYFSSPTPVLGPNNAAHTLTFKYDGTKFNVVSSGPAGWLSLPLLRQLLAVQP